MEIINNDFAKDLSKILRKHKKTISSTRDGIIVLDDKVGTSVLIMHSNSASDSYGDKLMLVTGEDINK